MPDGQGPDRQALIADILSLAGAALPEAEALLTAGQAVLRDRVCAGGKVSGAALDTHQHAAHALAWLATYVEALRQMQGWAVRLTDEGRFGEMEALIHQIGFGEYLCQIHGGIPMSQGEMARLSNVRRPACNSLAKRCLARSIMLGLASMDKTR